jgi:hypothetical protein
MKHRLVTFILDAHKDILQRIEQVIDYISVTIELTSSLRIGEFPCRLLRTKNHHFAALRFPDFQRQ